MSFIKLISRNNRGLYCKFNQITCTYTTEVANNENQGKIISIYKTCISLNTYFPDNFKPLNLKHVKGQIQPRKRYKKAEAMQPRFFFY